MIVWPFLINLYSTSQRQLDKHQSQSGLHSQSPRPSESRSALQSGPRFIKDQCKVKLRMGLLSGGAKFESTMAESFELEVSYSGS